MDQLLKCKLTRELEGSGAATSEDSARGANRPSKPGRVTVSGIVGTGAVGNQCIEESRVVILTRAQNIGLVEQVESLANHLARKTLREMELF
jgi:hypothetical protein